MRSLNSIATLFLAVGCGGGSFGSSDSTIDASTMGASEAGAGTVDVNDALAAVDNVVVADVDVDVRADAAAIGPTACPPGSLRVFVTSMPYSGNLGGRAGGDNRCKTLADAATLGASAWVAWLSDQTNVIDLLPQDGVWCLVDRSKLVATRSDLTSGALKHPINMFETGAPASEPGGLMMPTATWTGTLGSGLAAAAHCDNWTKDGVAAFGVRGNYAVPTRDWTQWPVPGLPGVSCSNANRLYCFETK